jgi:NADPH:quinone reductase-like Zn-dependent oxidoreductase
MTKVKRINIDISSVREGNGFSVGGCYGDENLGLDCVCEWVSRREQGDNDGQHRRHDQHTNEIGRRLFRRFVSAEFGHAISLWLMVSADVKRARRGGYELGGPAQIRPRKARLRPHVLPCGRGRHENDMTCDGWIVSFRRVWNVAAQKRASSGLPDYPEEIEAHYVAENCQACSFLAIPFSAKAPQRKQCMTATSEVPMSMIEITKAAHQGYKTMTAYRVHKFGGPDAILAERLPCPRPGPGQLLVKVHAVGVGPWDAWIRSGQSAQPQALPLTLGSDFSGVVANVGPGVREYREGDAVFGVTNARFVGAYAEYAIVETEMIARKPVSIGDIPAASVPVGAVTAKQALFRHAKLHAGQRVLIHGAAGNVGSFAVKHPWKARLHVTATASAKAERYLYDLGATKVIDYGETQFQDAIRDVDAVIDLVGGDTQDRSFSVLRPGGRLVSAVSKPKEGLAAQYRVDAKFFFVDVNAGDLIDIAASIDVGELRTNVGETLPLSMAVEAHHMLEGTHPHKPGKIVLTVA